MDINWSQVKIVIETQGEGKPRLADWDVEDAVRMCKGAYERWGEKDVKECKELVSLETEFSCAIATDVSFHGVIDLGYKNNNDEIIIIDWKTSRSTLDINWQQRLIDSFQWRMYAAATNAKRVTYRGINRKSPVEFRDCVIEVPESTPAEVYGQIAGIYAMRSSLVSAQLPVWPRNSPRACFAYGDRCVHLKDCQGYSMPRGIPNLHEISYSQMDEFLLCPEKYRRTQGDEKDKDEETLFGTIVHRGLAEVWQQLLPPQK